MNYKNILIVVDKGNVFEITDTTVQPKDYKVDNETAWECKDKAVFDFIKGKLQNNQVQFSKETTGNLLKEDLVIFPLDKMSYKRGKTLNKAREYISTRLNAVALFDLYEFMICNNELLERGFTVTNENRRDQYIKIIEKGDPETIDLLEKLVTVKERLESVAGWYRQYRDFEKDINRCSTVDEIDERYATFIQIFE